MHYRSITFKWVSLILIGMPWFELSSLLLGGALVWVWLDSIRAREIAVRAAGLACAEEGLQLLDETVAIRSLRMGRSADGRLMFRRVYEFEFSDSGNDRHPGAVTLCGHDIELLQVRPKLYVVPRSAGPDN